MQVIVLRHAEPRRGERDPALTSTGRRQARETALWVQTLGLSVERIWSTPTQRTRDTAEELGLVFPGVPTRVTEIAPESSGEWQRLVDTLQADLNGDGDASASQPAVAVVGHHPTIGFLLHSFGPSPMAVPTGYYACALLLSGGAGDPWHITAAWPGRAP